MLGIKQLHQALAATLFNMKNHAEMLRQENKDALHNAIKNQQLLDFFTEFSFDEEITIGGFSLRQANCLKKDLTWEEDFKRGLNYDLLILGSGVSGDMVALDLQDFQAGILFHDYFWNESEKGLRKFLIKMNCSLGQFYLNSVEVSDYPIDAYEAAAYIGAEFTGYSDL